nr:iron chelate uptake ABC transporter family permease subunit [Geodermatophilus chilensis]
MSRWRTRLRYGVLLAVLAVVLLAALTTGVAVGSVAIAPSTVWQVVAAHLSGQALGAGGGVDGIVWQLRLPRVLLAAVAGASLTAVGVTIQALVRNPLADPYVLGVSSGASVGATAVLLFGSLGWLGCMRCPARRSSARLPPWWSSSPSPSTRAGSARCGWCWRAWPWPWPWPTPTGAS